MIDAKAGAAKRVPLPFPADTIVNVANVTARPVMFMIRAVVLTSQRSLLRYRTVFYNLQITMLVT